MQRLPAIAAGPAMCRLPLSDRSAAALLAVLTEEDFGRRSARCEQVLRRDPPLVVWTVIHPRRPKTPPSDLQELADWLALQAVSILGEPEPGGSASSPADDCSCSQRWAERAGAALALAEQAAQLTDDPGIASRARLGAMLLDAEEWILSCLAPRDDHAMELLAPEWLRRLPSELRHGAESADPGWRAIAQALQQPALSAETYAAEWSQTIPEVADLLPAVASRFARLNTLEQEFQTALRREKLASLQKFAYGASHEINNPLANIASRAQSLLPGEADPERRRTLATINDQAFRAFEMIANLMLFAKPPDLRLAATDVHQVIGKVVQEMTPAAEQQGTAIEVALANEPLVITADATQLAVLLRALCRNALEAVECGGVVTISARRESQNAIELSVHDTGPGLSEEARRHLFDPFYSSREAGRGLGFGLSWCWTIVELHQGRLDYESAPGSTRFCVSLPIAGPTTSPAA